MSAEDRGGQGMSVPISPAALAYLGVAVIEVWVRGMLVRSGLSGTRELNAAALVGIAVFRFVQRKITGHFTEKRSEAFRLGRGNGLPSL